MRTKKLAVVMISLITAFSLAACSDEGETNENDKTNAGDSTEQMTGNGNKTEDTEEMEHTHSEEVTRDMIVSKDPKYPVGSEVIINADHMEGMNGADGKVVSAYDTTAYTVTYTPTDGGDKVKNHKWVVQEEIKDHGKEPYKPGDKVTLNTNHMEGMDGAEAEIEKAEKTTVYMLDYKPTNGGNEVKNHLWITESELAPKK